MATAPPPSPARGRTTMGEGRRKSPGRCIETARAISCSPPAGIRAQGSTTKTPCRAPSPRFTTAVIWRVLSMDTTTTWKPIGGLAMDRARMKPMRIWLVTGPFRPRSYYRDILGFGTGGCLAGRAAGDQSPAAPKSSSNLNANVGSRSFQNLLCLLDIIHGECQIHQIAFQADNVGGM